MMVVMIQQHRGRILFVFKVVRLMCKSFIKSGERSEVPNTYLRDKKHHHPRKE
jgi:hypothetical protein